MLLVNLGAVGRGEDVRGAVLGCWGARREHVGGWTYRFFPGIQGSRESSREAGTGARRPFPGGRGPAGGLARDAGIQESRDRPPSRLAGGDAGIQESRDRGIGRRRVGARGTGRDAGIRGSRDSGVISGRRPGRDGQESRDSGIDRRRVLRAGTRGSRNPGIGGSDGDVSELVGRAGTRGSGDRGIPA